MKLNLGKNEFIFHAGTKKIIQKFFLMEEEF